MERMIGCCGIDCSRCDAFLAKKENYSPEKRKAIAEKWAREYGGNQANTSATARPAR